jgi:hypothetical protein
MVLLRRVQALLVTVASSSFFSSFFPLFFGWLERGTHLLARKTHLASRSWVLPIHTQREKRTAKLR